MAKDDAEALKWYRLSAGQGDPGAQFNLGVIYANGQGVARDYVQAYLWLSLAVARFPRFSPDSDAATKNRDAVAAAMTPAQLAEAQKLVGAWKPAP